MLISSVLLLIFYNALIYLAYKHPCIYTVGRKKRAS